MATNLNSGINIPILFKQMITKHHAVEDYNWGDNDKTIDAHIGVRDTISYTPTTRTFDLDYGWFQDPDNSNHWFNMALDRKPKTVTRTAGACNEVALADLDATNEFFWMDGTGNTQPVLYVYDNSGEPTDVSITAFTDTDKLIYALTTFGIHTEELLNSPIMEIDEGWYSALENISWASDAAFRTTATLSYAFAIQYSYGQNGFYNSFFYHRNTRPWQFMAFEDNFFRKYQLPSVKPTLEQDINQDVQDVIGDSEWSRNVTITCAAKMKDLESVKYGSSSNFSTEVWDPRNRAFAFGMSYSIEYSGAVHAGWSDFLQACHYWAIGIMKVKGKAVDWKKAFYTDNNGSSYTDVTSDINLKNNINKDFLDTTNDWIALCLDSEKTFALTLKIHELGVMETGLVSIQYLNSSDVWSNFPDGTERDGNFGPSQSNHFNSTCKFQMKTLGDFYRMSFYSPTDWTQRTLNSVSGYWIRVKPSVSHGVFKVAWIVNSGHTVLTRETSGTWYYDGSVAPSTLTSGFVPLSVKYIEEKKQIWCGFVDLHTRKYYANAIQLNSTNINDSGKRSYDYSYSRLYNKETNYTHGKKFNSFAYGSSDYIFSLLVDDRKPDGVSQIVRFSTDVQNDEDYNIVQDLVGGEGNTKTVMKTNYAQVAFPETDGGERKYGICGITSPLKGTFWEFTNRRNSYMNLHKVVSKSLREIIRDLVLINNSVFYTDSNGILRFKNKNLIGPSEYSYTLSDRAGYGNGVIKRLSNVKLYENIINKVKVSWNSSVYGSGWKEIGSGIGIGKQISISNELIDDEFTALSISSDIFSDYAHIREQIGMLTALLFFLEQSDVVRIQIQHPDIYMDSTKEWLIIGYDIDSNGIGMSLRLVERLLEE